MRTFVVAYYW